MLDPREKVADRGRVPHPAPRRAHLACIQGLGDAGESTDALGTQILEDRPKLDRVRVCLLADRGERSLVPLPGLPERPSAVRVPELDPAAFRSCERARGTGTGTDQETQERP
jgi:hypothetical protein